MDILSYAMGKKAGGGGSTINNQDKTLTSNGQYTADSGYTGLGTVTVNVPEPSGTISITQNGDNIDVKDYAKANVNVPEPTGNINITDTNQTNVKDYATAQVVDEDLVAGNIKKDVNILGVVGTYEGSGGSRDWSEIGYSAEPQTIQDGFDYAKEIYDNWSLNKKINKDYNLLFMPLVNTTEKTSFYQMLQGCTALIFCPQLDTSSGTNFQQMFSGCYALQKISQLDTSSGTNFSQMFNQCYGLQTIPQLNTSSGTNFQQMFSECYNLTTIPQLNTSSGTNFSQMFSFCRYLTTIPQLNTSSGTNFNTMFKNCTALQTLPELNTEQCLNIKDVFVKTSSDDFILSTFGGFKDLGKAYLTTASANNSNYTLNLSYCTQLTHDSLMNVINKLYDIATAGVQAQQLVLGATNLAKLTAEEISTATNRGWSVS